MIDLHRQIYFKNGFVKKCELGLWLCVDNLLAKNEGRNVKTAFRELFQRFTFSVSRKYFLLICKFIKISSDRIDS